MSLSTPWTVAQLLTAVRRELLDSNPQRYYWTDSELINYIQDWQDRIQYELDFVWGTAFTIVGPGTSTIALTDIADDILTLRDSRWNGYRLLYRTVEELNQIQYDWRDAESVPTPSTIYQEDQDTLSFWPTPSKPGRVSLEYTMRLDVATYNDVLQVPVWAKYSAIPYCAMRAYFRQGPNMDINKGLRYRNIFSKAIDDLRSLKASYFPKRIKHLLPDILPLVRFDAMPVPAQAARFYDEQPSGVVDGVNNTFTLTNAPNPAISLKLWNDGILLTQGVHYTLNGNTITFIPPYTPVIGQILFASYRYLT